MAGLARFKDWCIDANDVSVIAGFWAQVLGLKNEALPDGDAKLTGDGIVIWINKVPEPKTAKNRVHVDVDLHGDNPGPLVEAGATVTADPAEGRRWWVMADPEGNEFCAFPA